MPQLDSRIGELSRLRNRIIELDALLKEEKKISARLRDQSEKKSEQIAIADAEIAAEMERYRWKKEETMYAIKSFERDTRGKIGVHKYDEKRLLEELAESEVIQHTNDVLHQKLKEIASQQTNLNQTNLAEREARKQKDFDTRMAMEEVLRKMIKNVDESYQNDAIAKMQLEASQADSENDRIHTEFSLREAKTESLIRQQQRSYELLMRSKIERDVMAVSTEVMDKNITKMQEQNDISEIKVRVLQKKVQSLKDEVSSLSAALESKQELDKHCRQILRGINEQSDVLEQWRKVTMKICHRILKECLEIAHKQRIRDNARLTQQLDELTAAAQEDDGSQGSRSRHSSMHEDDDLSMRSSQYDNMDFEAIWRCPANNNIRHFYSAGKLVTTNDWRRMKTLQSGEMNRNQSDSMLIVSSQSYKSFSM